MIGTKLQKNNLLRQETQLWNDAPNEFKPAKAYEKFVVIIDGFLIMVFLTVNY